MDNALSTQNNEDQLPVSMQELADLLPAPKPVADLGPDFFISRAFFVLVQGPSKYKAAPYNALDGDFLLIEGTSAMVLGKEVQVYPADWRHRAQRLVDGRLQVTYDPTSELYAVCDSIVRSTPPGQTAEAMVGIELLCYLPSVRKCVTFFAFNKSGIIAVKQGVIPLLQTPIVLSSKPEVRKNRPYLELTATRCAPFAIPREDALVLRTEMDDFAAAIPPEPAVIEPEVVEGEATPLPGGMER